MKTIELLKELEGVVVLDKKTMSLIDRKIKVFSYVLGIDEFEIHSLATALRFYLRPLRRIVSEETLINKLKETYDVSNGFLKSHCKSKINSLDRYALLYACLNVMKPEEIYSAEELKELISEAFPNSKFSEASLKQFRSHLQLLTTDGALTRLDDLVTRGQSKLVYYALNDIREILDNVWFIKYVKEGIYKVER